MFLATLEQIAAAPKAKPKRRINRSTTNKARIERDRKKPNKITPKASNKRRSEDAMALWRRVLNGKALNAHQIADASGRKLEGVYSAIYRLKNLGLVKVARQEPSLVGGRPILYWTWDNKGEQKMKNDSEGQGKK